MRKRVVLWCVCLYEVVVVQKQWRKFVKTVSKPGPGLLLHCKKNRCQHGTQQQQFELEEYYPFSSSITLFTHFYDSDDSAAAAAAVSFCLFSPYSRLHKYQLSSDDGAFRSFSCCCSFHHFHNTTPVSQNEPAGHSEKREQSSKCACGLAFAAAVLIQLLPFFHFDY